MKETLPKKTVLVKKLDSLFSLFVRLRGKLRTGGMCEICGRRPIHCAFHFVSRGNYAVRWDIFNSCSSCKNCNFSEYINRREMNKKRFRDAHIRLYGIDEVCRVEALAQSRPGNKFEREELQEIYDQLKEKFETLKYRSLM